MVYVKSGRIFSSGLNIITNSPIEYVPLANVTDYDIISHEDSPFYGYNMQYDGVNLAFHQSQNPLKLGQSFTKVFILTASRSDSADTALLVARKKLPFSAVKLSGSSLIKIDRDYVFRQYELVTRFNIEYGRVYATGENITFDILCHGRENCPFDIRSDKLNSLCRDRRMLFQNTFSLARKFEMELLAIPWKDSFCKDSNWSSC